MTEELKRCQSCKKLPIVRCFVRGSVYAPNIYDTVCLRCNLQTDTSHDTQEKAIAAWNTRHGEK